MKYMIWTEKTADTTKDRVLTVHNMPELLSDKEKMGGIEIDDIQAPLPTQAGKDAVLYRNTQTGALFYEYESRALSQEEQIAELTQQINDMSIAMAAMLGQ